MPETGLITQTNPQLPTQQIGSAGQQGLPMDETPYRRLGLGILFITFVALGLWAGLAPLHSAVVANGQVIVASHNKQIQHLDGGIVKTIHVHEGENVQQGQALLELDATQWRSQLENVQGQLWDTEANLARLSAERDGANSLTWPDELQKPAASPTLKDILSTQKEMFKARQQSLDANQEMLTQRLTQTRKQIEGDEKQIISLKKRRDSLSSDVSSLEKLADKNLVAKATLRETQRAYEEVLGDLAKVESEVARLHEVLPEIRQQLALSREEYLKEVSTGISDFQTKRIQLSAQQQSLEDKLSRVTITAPVTGKVKSLNIVTLGGVITPGQIIMEIVPDEQKFQIIAQLSSADINDIKVGEIAEIKFISSSDTRLLPTIHARLIDRSTDTFPDEHSQQRFYKLTLELQDDALQLLKEQDIVLISGMTAEIFLPTSQHTLVSYLLRPLSRLLDHSLNEK